MEPEWNNRFGKTLLTLTPDIYGAVFQILWHIRWNLTGWYIVLHEQILSCDVGPVFTLLLFAVGPVWGWFWVAAWLLLSHRPGNPATSPIWLPLWVWSVHPFTLNRFWTVVSAQIAHCLSTDSWMCLGKKGSPSAVFSPGFKSNQISSRIMQRGTHVTSRLQAQKVEATSLSAPS